MDVTVSHFSVFYGITAEKAGNGCCHF